MNGMPSGPEALCTGNLLDWRPSEQEALDRRPSEQEAFWIGGHLDRRLSTPEALLTGDLPGKGAP